MLHSCSRMFIQILIVMVYNTIYIIQLYYMIIEILSKILNVIGENGSIILLFLSVYFLWEKHKLLFYYIIGYFINRLLNIILKGIIKQPRPTEDMRLFPVVLSTGKQFINKDGIKYEMFGMPSGHTQNCIYSTIFIYFALKKESILYFYLLISFLVVLQRIINNYHSFFQTVVGAIVGGLFGYLMYRLARENIKGFIQERLDDFGPLYN